MYKVFSEKFYQVNEKLSLHCQAEGTRYGFRHLVTLWQDGRVIARSKECYYNRTWESWEFQSAIRGLASKVTGPVAAMVQEFAERKYPDAQAQEDEKSILHTIALAASIGSILMPDLKESNDWKARMIRAGLENRGLEMPDDWDALPEEEKQRRLDKVINELRF
jgi:hypothetical protein